MLKRFCIALVVCLIAAIVLAPRPRGPRRTLYGHSRWIAGLEFLPDGHTLVSASGTGDDRVMFWDVRSGEIIHEIPQGSGVWSMKLSPNGRILAVGLADQTIKLWDVSSTNLLRVLPAMSTMPYSLSFSPDCRMLAGSYRYGPVRLWDVATGKLTRQLAGVGSPLSFSSDGRLLATYDDHKQNMVLLSTSDWTRVGELEGHIRHSFITAVAFSRDSKTIVTGGTDETARVWDVADRKQLSVFHHRWGVYAVEFTDADQRIITGADDSCQLWDLKSRRRTHTLRTNVGSVPCVAVSAGGATIAVGGRKGTIELWGIPK